MRRHFEPRYDFGRRQTAEAGVELRTWGADEDAFPVSAGTRATLALRAGPGGSAPLSREQVERDVEQTSARWMHWAGRATYEGPWREAVVRSALVLKLLTFGPSGAIVARRRPRCPRRSAATRTGTTATRGCATGSTRCAPCSRSATSRRPRPSSAGRCGPRSRRLPRSVRSIASTGAGASARRRSTCPATGRHGRCDGQRCFPPAPARQLRTPARERRPAALARRLPRHRRWAAAGRLRGLRCGGMAAARCRHLGSAR